MVGKKRETRTDVKGREKTRKEGTILLLLNLQNLLKVLGELGAKS